MNKHLLSVSNHLDIWRQTSLAAVSSCSSAALLSLLCSFRGVQRYLQFADRDNPLITFTGFLPLQLSTITLSSGISFLSYNAPTEWSTAICLYVILRTPKPLICEAWCMTHIVVILLNNQQRIKPFFPFCGSRSCRMSNLI